jgi:hypothetical protein
MTKKKTINWDKLWKKFDKWQETEYNRRRCWACDAHDTVEWWEQQEKIMELVDKAIN